ncbi:hypothetical protein HN51_064362 [Arachis hypogaea]|uniref:WD-40 repeat-containing protein MSI4 isoform X1 n=1 Tax=Arachis ipaensis TaxID=130454 RepID=UPI0007AF1B3C|nr:WD-40 repeat-containing protein MSI4 isoform X1 [Arachis ipaensis]XP_025630848.1 WD-40 repeat-containing protein MSI4 isoform X1 [Arachis hypogaea]QHO22001.1 WD-40 repeat-containing protein [Arachis hypogaea]
MESGGEEVVVKKKRGRKPKPKNEEGQQQQVKTPKESKRSQQQHHQHQHQQHVNANAEDKYNRWKAVVPVLYDWLSNHNLLWPSLSCRWGPQLEQSHHKNRQRLYLSEQTDGSVPNTLVIATCDVVKPRVAAADHISQFNEEARSPFVKKYKTIIHPGEVNRIREMPQHSNIVATHTDSPNVLIWDVEAQPNRHAVLGATNSRPDLILTGHQDNAEFALAMCPTGPYVLSGGKDKSVVFWSIEDHITSAADSKSGGSINKQNTKSGEGNDKSADGPSVGPRGIYCGHDETVEDVAFCPFNAQEFCSVGDDSCLILWDARAGSGPAVKVEKAHDADLHCVDWNFHDVNLILTGSADNSVRMFDRRKLTSNGVGSAVHKFEGHSAAVLSVQWSPDKSSIFGSSAEDGLLNIWDYEKVGKTTERSGTTASSPAGLFFQHAGHRDKVVDFHWNSYDPWTMVSVSDDCDSNGGGGTLQIWRMSDLIYRPEEEVLSELEKFKSHVLTCAAAK